MRTDFDCIIVGAGCAGATLAKKLAEAGLATVLLDRKPLERIGFLWEVAVEKDVFSRIGMKFPDAGLWEERPEYSRYYVNDISDYIEIDASHDDGFFIQHYKINHYLLDLSFRAGVEFRQSYWVRELIIEAQQVTGVMGTCRTFWGSREFKLTARIVIEATGIDAVLRKQVPKSFLIQRTISSQDFASGWNEIREVSQTQQQQLAEKYNLTPGVLYTRMGKYQAYAVLHLRKNNTVNLIFGAAYRKKSKSARIICHQFLAENPYFGKKINGGGGLIPLRRAIDTMVGGGLLCIGDAACQVIPTMGSGVASSLHAADIATQVICNAFNRSDFSREKLWVYNYKYHTKRGAVLASYDVIRRFLQSMSSAEMNEVFKAHLVTNENFLSTFSSKTIKYNVGQIVDNILKVLSHLSILPVSLRFIQTLRDSQRAIRLYKNYPAEYDPAAFKLWMKNTVELFMHYDTAQDS